MSKPIVVEICRGENVESVHEVLVCVVDAQGKTLFEFGDSRFATYLRSAAKPFQVLPFLQSGASAKVGATDIEIALACASHLGQDFHVKAVAEFLQRAAISTDALQNYEHPANKEAPFCCDEPHKDVTRVLKQNCSGKHAAFLVTQQYWGEPLSDYRDPKSRLQKMVFQNVSNLSRTPLAQIENTIAPDGCGAPIFQLPLKNFAQMYAELGAASRLSEAEPLGKVYQVMRDYPQYVRGDGDLNTELIRAFGGRLIAKVGYEGVYGLALASGVGVAFKVKDGNVRALPPAILHILKMVFPSSDAAFAALQKWQEPSLDNIHHVAVGKIRMGIVA